MNRSQISKRLAVRKSQFGQGMTEYIIIVALVAIGAIGVYSAFGHTVEAQMAEITSGLAGRGSGESGNTQLVGSEAQAATAAAATNLGLDNYGSNVKDQ